jgi:ATP-binding cassette subfamily F protein uup
VFEREGRVQEYVGGYEDWVRQQGTLKIGSSKTWGNHVIKTDRTAAAKTAVKRPDKSVRPAKANFREQQELNQLPDRIEALEVEQRDLAARVEGADFYKESREAITSTLDRLSALEKEILEAYARWNELEERCR